MSDLSDAERPFALHDNPAIFGPLPGKEADPELLRLCAQPGIWQRCWEYVLTHEMTEGERTAFWTGADLMREDQGRDLEQRALAAEARAARLAEVVARVEALEAAVGRVRRRHPRGDEEAGMLAPGLWCPTCGQERSDNGYGGCPERVALNSPDAEAGA